MAVGSVIEKVGMLTVLDERGRHLAFIPISPGSARLAGYTASVVTVRQGAYLHTYDERGRQLQIIQAGL